MLATQPLLAALSFGLLALSEGPTGARGDNVAGYNAFNPKSASASTKPETDPKNFDDVMPTTTPGSSSLRAAFASSSNCFKTGGGEVPEYYICRGLGDYAGHDEQYYCQTDEALHCLEDLRHNRSRNVHPSCSYNVSKVYCNATEDFSTDSENRTGHCWTEEVSKSGMQLLGIDENVDEWGACCPNLNGTIDDFEASSAYPDALLCLKEAHCDEDFVSGLFQDLQAECEERCCAGGACYYPLSHPNPLLAGQLKRGAKQPDGSVLFTEDGGPCTPSITAGAWGRLQPTLLSAIGPLVVVAWLTSLSL